ncbi:hypothetical protein ACYT6T_10295, partial [Streptococcus pyogenes]
RSSFSFKGNHRGNGLKWQSGIEEYRIYQRYLKYLERTIDRGFVSSFQYVMLIGLRVGRRLLRELVTLGPSLRSILSGKLAK